MRDIKWERQTVWEAHNGRGEEEREKKNIQSKKYADFIIIIIIVEAVRIEKLDHSLVVINVFFFFVC